MPDFHGHVFIATSVDGFIAKPDGDLAWLIERGESIPDSGYDAFVDSVDALIMGRTTYETVAGFDGDWPYPKPVFVLSTTLDPATVTQPGVSVHRGMQEVLEAFAEAGFSDAYVDGGKTIQAFMDAGLIERIIVSLAPVLIGSGARLFGPVPEDVPLELVSANDIGGGFAQLEYRVASATD